MGGTPDSGNLVTLNGRDIISIRGRIVVVGEATRIVVASEIEDPSRSVQMEETHGLNFRERWNLETMQLWI